MKEATLAQGTTNRDRRDPKVQANNKELMRRIAELEDANAELRRQVMTDEMTGLFNKAGFYREMGKLVTHWAPDSEPSSPQKDDGLVRRITVARFDGDFFKQVNDTFGHAGGDAAIKGIARALLGAFRPIDLVARLSGDEFAVAGVNVGVEAIMKKLGQDGEKDVPARIGTVVVPFEGTDITITLSGGLAKFAMLPPEYEGEPHNEIVRRSIEVSLAKADKAAYMAKETGRNQILPFNRQDS